MKTYDIIIATPGFTVTQQYLGSLMDTIEVLNEQKITWKVINYGASYVRMARDAIMNLGQDFNLDNQTPFLGEFDYKKIMWIDNDISWKPEDILKLYKSERDIICGAYMTSDGTIAVSFDGMNVANPEQIPTNRESRVVTCGFGFICIKKGVFEKMPKPWFDNEVFEINGQQMTYAGEDVSWCHKARRSGFEIWFDPNVSVIHYKVSPLKWNKG
jgi:hypothetical protein